MRKAHEEGLDGCLCEVTRKLRAQQSDAVVHLLFQVIDLIDRICEGMCDGIHEDDAEMRW